MQSDQNEVTATNPYGAYMGNMSQRNANLPTAVNEMPTLMDGDYNPNPSVPQYGPQAQWYQTAQQKGIMPYQLSPNLQNGPNHEMAQQQMQHQVPFQDPIDAITRSPNQDMNVAGQPMAYQQTNYTTPKTNPYVPQSQNRANQATIEQCRHQVAQMGEPPAGSAFVMHKTARNGQILTGFGVFYFDHNGICVVSSETAKELVQNWPDEMAARFSGQEKGIPQKAVTPPFVRPQPTKNDVAHQAQQAYQVTATPISQDADALRLSAQQAQLERVLVQNKQLQKQIDLLQNHQQTPSQTMLHACGGDPVASEFFLSLLEFDQAAVQVHKSIHEYLKVQDFKGLIRELWQNAQIGPLPPELHTSPSDELQAASDQQDKKVSSSKDERLPILPILDASATNTSVETKQPKGQTQKNPRRRKPNLDKVQKKKNVSSKKESQSEAQNSPAVLGGTTQN